MTENQCIFCGIIAGKIPAKKVYEDSYVIAILDINPRNPGHTLVIPKDHAGTIFEMKNEDIGNVFQSVRNVAVKAINAMKAQGANIVQSNGAVAGQMVPHVHFHVIPRFANEGPVSIEAVLQVKKMNEEMLDKIAEKIESAELENPSDIEKGIEEAVERAVPEPKKPVKEKTDFSPAKKKSKKEEELEEIDFNF
ncbi:MAG: HIT family protein [Candidatus Aenigmarchaeota archaeon]|nr:HIT family protein [Candidatus Aenigmarchaeota archaeon]